MRRSASGRIARAVARTPAILLLDEATSHLDVETERVVHRNLNRLACTTVGVAHRLSTVRDADLILVLDGGRIIERGTHDQLVALQGHYHSLISRSPEIGTHFSERDELRAHVRGLSGPSDPGI
jgi:ATP-binding cassette subfamily B protein